MVTGNENFKKKICTYVRQKYINLYQTRTGHTTMIFSPLYTFLQIHLTSKSAYFSQHFSIF